MSPGHDRHELRIERVAAGGAGVARLPDGKTCFVRGTVPGERVLAQIVSEKKRYAEAGLLEVLEPSPRRTPPPCPVFGTCGGCDYQHIDYALQTEIKRGHVIDALTRIARIPEPPVAAMRAAPQPYGYRNRITVHAMGGATGFFERGTRRVVDVARCAIADEAVNSALAALRSSNPREGSHPLRPNSAFRGFRQVNDSAAEILLDVVSGAVVEGGGRLVDAYCGAGFFAKAFVPRFEEIIGIEWSEGAVCEARQQADPKERYLAGDVAEILPGVLAAHPTDLVILDPPAEGLAREVIDALIANPPARVVYVSCDPATQARDIARLVGAFDLLSACPVDMFPQTAHIECVATLTQSNFS